jgi:hypothetical protein
MDDESCLVASFERERPFEAALEELEKSRVDVLRTYTPKPMAAGASRAPLIGLLGGLAGLVLMFALEVYANILGYPLDIGGRPKFSWPSFIPIAFEVGILWAVVGVIVGAFVFGRFLTFCEPIDACDLLRRALSDRWIVVVRSPHRESRTLARHICEASGAVEIEEFRYEAHGPHFDRAAVHRL